MNKNIAPILALAAIVVIGGGALMASRANSTKSQSAMTTMSPSPTAAAALDEKQFIEQMISHHADAIGMAQLAPDKAKTTEVKVLAANIASAQQKEIDEMKGWYKSWYGKDVPEMTDMSGMSESSGKMMNDLRSSSNFDLAFVTQMIPHHESAIKMAKAVLPTANHQEIKDLANSIISSQTAEIEQMKMLKQTL